MPSFACDGSSGDCLKAGKELDTLRSLVKEMAQALFDCEVGNCWKRGNISRVLTKVPHELWREP
jgi:hypothetical protein